MEPLPESANPGWPFPFTPQDWEQTPPAVQAYLRTVRDALGQLHERVDTLEARLTQHSTTSSRPPSSDSPYKKPRQRPTATTPQKAGGKPGHPGHRQVLLSPTTVHALRPERCACGNTTLALLRPYHTHQVLELPPIDDGCDALGGARRLVSGVRPLEESPGDPPSMPREMAHAAVP